MTDAELQAIKERAERATVGPWNVLDKYTIWQGDGDKQIGGTESRPGWGMQWDSSVKSNNAAFIAAARTDVPALIVEVERMRAALLEINTYNRMRNDTEAYLHHVVVYALGNAQVRPDPDDYGITAKDTPTI